MHLEPVYPSMASLPLFLCTLLTFSLSFHRIAAVNYAVLQEARLKDHPGNKKFNEVVGVPFTKQIMGEINNFIWSAILKQNTKADQKPVNTVTVFITLFNGEAVEASDGDKILVNANYFLKYQKPEDLKWNFKSVMYHEMTHIFQWLTPGIPVPLKEGIADYTVLKANYAPPGFCKPGAGDKWDQGFDFTARFLEYCDGLVPGFVAKLNNMMKRSYNVLYFKNITGKPVEQLWKDYKAKYAGKGKKV